MSNFTKVGKALSSPIASFSTPDDKVECAKIHQLYLRNGSSFGLQILQASQPSIALWVCKILPTWAKALSSPIASFSTLVAKAQSTKIRDLYLGNGFDGGLQILHGSQPNMVLWVCQILAWWPKSLSSLIASSSTLGNKAASAKICNLYLGNGLRVKSYQARTNIYL